MNRGILWWLLLSVLSCAAYAVFIDYAENTELIQQRAGYDVKLQCDLKGLLDESSVAANIQIHWYFKQCGDGAVGVAGSNKNCVDPNESDWTQLLCEHNFCTPQFLLHNVTVHYSGLYKCVLYPYRSPDAAETPLLVPQIVHTFQLDVKNESSNAAPELLDQYPRNQTVAFGSQAVFQCRVYSELHPTIKWFRRISDPAEALTAREQVAANKKLVLHEGHVYELLKARAKPLNDGIYLSELTLQEVRLQDEGVYVCVAISVHGHSMREAHLAVYTKEEMDQTEDYWTEYEDDTDELRSGPNKFWVFFLMPLGLALLPLSVWAAWLLHRRCQRHDATMLDAGGSKCSDEEMATERAMLSR